MTVLGLDFVRDWEILLGVWILAGFAAVALNNLLQAWDGKVASYTNDVWLFFMGPIWWVATVNDILGRILRAVFRG